MRIFQPFWGKTGRIITNSDLYSLTETVTDLTFYNSCYFLSEGEDMNEVKFGDIRRTALNDGEVVVLEYLVTSGAEANEVTNFSIITTATETSEKFFPFY